MTAEEVRLITTSDGVRLRAGLRTPPRARRTAVLCHPHPDHGGTMETTLIAELSHALAEEGIAALRFDFRRPGTGPERRLDVAAAVSEAGGDVLLVGWSFGADLALAAASTDRRIAGVAAIAPTFLWVAPEELAALNVPHMVLVPEHDRFNTPDDARRRLPCIEILEGADHLCGGREAEIARRVVAFEAGLPSGGGGGSV